MNIFESYLATLNGSVNAYNYYNLLLFVIKYKLLLFYAPNELEDCPVNTRPKIVTVSVRMPYELKLKIDEAREKEHRSISQQVVYMLVREFEHPTKKRRSLSELSE